jgi:hypothetical protein
VLRPVLALPSLQRISPSRSSIYQRHTDIIRDALDGGHSDLGDIGILVDMAQVEISELSPICPGRSATTRTEDLLGHCDLPEVHTKTVDMGCRQEIANRREGQTGSDRAGAERVHQSTGGDIECSNSRI